MRQGTIVYFQCNDWNPNPDEAARFIYKYILGDLYDDESILKTNEDIKNWIKENDLCVNMDIYDMSVNLWVTTTREWLEENFPELVEFASETPTDFMWEGDKKYYLKYSEENVGQFWCGNQLK